MIQIAKLYNADKGHSGRLSDKERTAILSSCEGAVKSSYLKENDTVYPRVEDGEIAIYLQPFCTDFYATGDARGEQGAGQDGNLLDPWDHVKRSR